MTPLELEKWADEMGFTSRHLGQDDRLVGVGPWDVLRISRQYWYMLLGYKREISPQIEARCRDMLIFHKIDMGVPLSSQDKAHIKASLSGKLHLEAK